MSFEKPNVFDIDKGDKVAFRTKNTIIFAEDGNQ